MTEFDIKYSALRKSILEEEFSGLNAMQREAVFCTEGPLLLLAGAGSGKTTVLINRVINLLKYGRGYEEEMAPVGAVPVDWNPYTQIRRSLGMKKGGLYICPAFDRRCSA